MGTLTVLYEKAFYLLLWMASDYAPVWHCKGDMMREMYCPYCNITRMVPSEDTHCEDCGTLLVSPDCNEWCPAHSVYEELLEDAEHYYYGV